MIWWPYAIDMYSYIDDFASKPHISVLLNVHEKPNTDRYSFHFNVFNIDKKHYQQISSSSNCMRF